MESTILFLPPLKKLEWRAGGGGSPLFGASRDGGTRQHDGIDLRCEPGEDAYAPATGILVRWGWCYPKQAGGYRLYEIETKDGWHVEGLYLTMSALLGRIYEGERVGMMLAISHRYPNMGMEDHLHLRVWRELREVPGKQFDDVRTLDMKHKQRGRIVTFYDPAPLIGM